MNRPTNRPPKQWMARGTYFAALLGMFALGTLFAQQKSSSSQASPPPPAAAAQHDMAAMPGMDAKDAKAADSSVPMVFCPTMKTGQLCTHGTSDALNCSG